MSETIKIINPADLTVLSNLEERILEIQEYKKLKLEGETATELKKSYSKIKDKHILVKRMRTEINLAKKDLLEPVKEYSNKIQAKAKELTERVLDVENYLQPLRDEYEAEEKKRKAEAKAKKEAELKALEEEKNRLLAEKESELEKAQRQIAELKARLEADAKAKEEDAKNKGANNETVQSGVNELPVDGKSSVQDDIPQVPEQPKENPLDEVEPLDLNKESEITYTEKEAFIKYANDLLAVEYVTNVSNPSAAEAPFKASIKKQLDKLANGIIKMANEKLK